MEWIKKYYKEIIIVLLALFGFNKCSTSCSRAKDIKDNEQIIHDKDSVINSLNDSIISLNMIIQRYEEKVSGLSQSLDIQERANKQIVESKKNISINVKK